MSAPPAVEQVTVVTQPATTAAAPASASTQTTTVVTQPATAPTTTAAAPTSAPTQTTTVVAQPAIASTTPATTSTVPETTKPVVTASKTPDDASISLDYKSAHVKLDVATTEEALYHSKRNAVSWKGPLQLEAYLRREAHLANQAFTRDGGLTTWVLLSTADASERRYLAGCETYRKRAFLSQDGVVKEVTAHGIGSVFVPEEHRGRKYAERMMEELGERLRTWKADQYPVLFSVLYSDIGKKFYSRLGWVPFPSSHIHIRPESSSMLWEKHGNVEPLHMTDLPKICALDEELIKKRLKEKVQTGTAVALIPDYKTIEWHHAREEFLANELFGKAPYVKGARADINGHKVYAIWTRVFGTSDINDTKGNTLHILRILVEEAPIDVDSSDFHPDHIAGIASVLRIAQKEAAEWHMHEIEIWNPHPRTLAAAQTVDPTSHLIHRDSESIASLKWYGNSETSVDWLEADKSGWC